MKVVIYSRKDRNIEMKNKIMRYSILFLIVISGIMLGNNKNRTVSATSSDYPVYRVMPMGDSITEGRVAGPLSIPFGGYRSFLEKKLLATGYAPCFDFVGRKNSGSGYDNDHNSSSGAMVSYDYNDILSVQTEVNNGVIEQYRPDIILLQIGTNDISCQYPLVADMDINTLHLRLKKLVDDIFERASKDTALYLASIPYMVGTYQRFNSDVNRYNAYIKKIVVLEQQQGRKCEFVDINSVLDETTTGDLKLGDLVHPTVLGYQKMADRWYDVLSEYFPDEPVTLPTQSPNEPEVSEEPVQTPTVTPTQTPVVASTVTPNLMSQTSKTVTAKVSPRPSVKKTANSSKKKKNTKKKNTLSADSLLNKEIVVKKARYRVLTSNTVLYIKNCDRFAKKVSIPSEIIYRKKKYKVTGVDKNTFFNNKKIKQLLIGKNVTRIGKRAFYKCSQLAKITYSGNKLKIVGKEAFYGISKKAVFTYPKKSKIKYSKLIEAAR